MDSDYRPSTTSYRSLIQSTQTPLQQHGLSLTNISKIKRMVIGNSKQVCTVCLDKFNKGKQPSYFLSNYQDDLIRKLPCKHMFHDKCIVPWLVDSAKCPICRLDLNQYYEQTD